MVPHLQAAPPKTNIGETKISRFHRYGGVCKESAHALLGYPTSPHGPNQDFQVPPIWRSVQRICTCAPRISDISPRPKPRFPGSTDMEECTKNLHMRSSDIR